MSFSFQGPPPSTSSPGRDNDNPSTNFNVELGSFLVSLSRTADNDMSSLEQQLARLKVAWREEVRKTGGESGEDSSDNISSIGSPKPDSPERAGSEMELSGSPANFSCPSTGTSPSSSAGEANSSSNSGGDSGDPSSLRDCRLLKFSVQRGARFDLKEEQLQEVFSKFGRLMRYRLFAQRNMGFDGFLEFVSAEVAASLINSLVKVGDCELHCSLPWDSLTSQPSPHQILLESRYLPNVWERDMILRSFFSKYGVVTGVSMIGFTPGKLLRYVVSFKDPNSAMDLIGSWVTILSSTVWVREVSCQTIPASSRGPVTNLSTSRRIPRSNSRRTPRSDLPWRK